MTTQQDGYMNALQYRARQQNGANTMYVLGIDTSCDDTAAAVVADGRRILSSVVMSQQRLHAEHGGVVPEVASRRHLEEIRPAVEQALADAGMGLDEISAVGATVGPGLAGSLIVGYNMGRALALGRGVPFVAVNHLEGHIYSAWLIADAARASLGVGGVPEPEWPLVVLIVSGGHTELVLMSGHGRYRRLGGTRDDAAGEAFDKVGRLLGLEYPGGPAIQRAAAALPPGTAAVALPRAWLRGGYDFSFSGLKTAVLHMVQQNDSERAGTAGERMKHTRTRGHPPAVHAAGEQTAIPRSDAEAEAVRIHAIAAGFQESVAEVLAVKTARAAEEFGARGVALCGGVAANSAVRESLRAALPPELPLFVPPPWLCTDNGAMIAAAGYYRLVASGFGVAEGASPDSAEVGADVRPGLALPV